MILPEPLLALLLPLLALAEQAPLLPSSDPLAKPYTIPPIGFGTWNLKVSDQNTTDAVSLAIQAGYRHIDAAKAYGNQLAVGKGIQDGLLKAGAIREDLWVTSKLWNDAHGDAETVEKALNETLKELGLGYLDLYLMHWPVGQEGGKGDLEFDYVETWQSMEKLLERGTVRQIGVSNFSPGQLLRLLRSAKHKPDVHQFELHPYLQQRWWVEWHKAHGIRVTAYSPLGNLNPVYHDAERQKRMGDGDDLRADPHVSCADEFADEVEKARREFAAEDVFFEEGREESKAGRPASKHTPPLITNNTIIQTIADRRGCTPAQIALAWGLHRGHAVIPKSSHERYIVENWESIRCVSRLTLRDMEEIAYVGEKWLHRFNNPGKGWGVRLFQGLDGI